MCLFGVPSTTVRSWHCQGSVRSCPGFLLVGRALLVPSGLGGTSSVSGTLDDDCWLAFGRLVRTQLPNQARLDLRAVPATPCQASKRQTHTMQDCRQAETECKECCVTMSAARSRALPHLHHVYVRYHDVHAGFEPALREASCQFNWRLQEDGTHAATTDMAPLPLSVSDYYRLLVTRC